MTDTQGVFITSASIYDAVLDVGRKVDVIETKIVAQDKVAVDNKAEAVADSIRIRTLEKQVSALWVLYGIMIAVVTSNAVRLFTG